MALIFWLIVLQFSIKNLIRITIITNYKKKVKGRKGKRLPHTNVSQNIKSEINAYLRNQQQHQYFLPIPNVLNILSPNHVYFLKLNQIIRILHSKWLLILNKSQKQQWLFFDSLSKTFTCYFRVKRNSTFPKYFPQGLGF